MPVETPQLQRYEGRTSWILVLLTLVFFVGYAWPVLDPDLDRGWRVACGWAVWLTWGALAIDFVVRIRLSGDAWGFVRRHPVDTAAIVLPMLRPLRLLRLLTLITAVERIGGRTLRGRVGVYLVGSVLLLTLIASLAVLDAERGSTGTISSFGDALWWSITTMTTVGYGDTYPVTTEGRFIAAGLMLSGIAVLGVVTASIASWLVEHVTDDERQRAETRREIDDLRAEVRALRETIERGR